MFKTFKKFEYTDEHKGDERGVKQDSTHENLCKKLITK